MPGERKMIAIGDFLTEAQGKLAIKLWIESGRKGGSSFNAAVVEQIIQPNLPEINRKLGQENDARFLAYAIEYALSQSQGRTGQ